MTGKKANTTSFFETDKEVELGNYSIPTVKKCRLSE